MILRKEVTCEIQAHILAERSFFCFIVSQLLLAHHGPSAFDLTKSISGKGTVTELEWRNPHVILHVDLKDDKGAARSWAIEMYNPLTMRRAGWNQDILKAGDEITIRFHPAKNGNTFGYIREDDGKIIFKGQELKLSSNAQ